MKLSAEDCIKYLPSSMGLNVEYYYRWGRVFYFRSLDKKRQIQLITSQIVADEFKKQLTRYKTYSNE